MEMVNRTRGLKGEKTSIYLFCNTFLAIMTHLQIGATSTSVLDFKHNFVHLQTDWKL